MTYAYCKACNNFSMYPLLPLLLLLFFLLPNAKCQTCGDTPSYSSGSFNVTLAGGNNRTFQLFTPWTEYECSSFCVGPPQEKRPLVINWHGEKGSSVRKLYWPPHYMGSSLFANYFLCTHSAALHPSPSLPQVATHMFRWLLIRNRFPA